MVDKYRGEQRTGATRTSRGVDNSRDEINKASMDSRGDDVDFVLPPDDGKGNFVLHEALLLHEDDFILPPDIPDDTGQVHARPPDKCAQNYVCRGGSPHSSVFLPILHTETVPYRGDSTKEITAFHYYPSGLGLAEFFVFTKIGVTYSVDIVLTKGGLLLAEIALGG